MLGISFIEFHLPCMADKDILTTNHFSENKNVLQFSLGGSRIPSCDRYNSKPITAFERERNIINDMSPNPENIDFLNNVLQQDDDREDEDDSGFCSGSLSLRSHRLLCARDHEILLRNESELFRCGFYYPDTDRMGAMKLLKKSMEGTFLVRNSSDSKHLFSLSVKTKCGATSVRISYQDGRFLFDCDERIRRRMPKFKSVLGLIDYHVKLSKQGANNSWRWEEKSGSKNMVLDVTTPCRTSAPSLKHLCNVQVNKSMKKLHYQIFNHPLRNKIDEHIKGYPYVV